MAVSRKGQIDMTIGHIMKNIILFAIPIIIGNVLQQLYTTVDALVIGQYCGDTSERVRSRLKYYYVFSWE